jgi:hypothetical protein
MMRNSFGQQNLSFIYVLKFIPLFAIAKIQIFENNSQQHVNR